MLNGALHAADREIGVPTVLKGSRHRERQPSSGWPRVLGATAVLVILAVSVAFRPGGLYGLGRRYEPSRDDGPQTPSLPPPGYTIKGNISVDTGERLYHAPGMRDYDITVIDLSRGERWFRTEEEARAAGWRRAGPQPPMYRP